MVWVPPPSGKRGRQQNFSDAAIQACLTLKVLFGLPLRQATGFVQSLLQLIGLDWAVPDFSTLCRRQRTLNVGLPYRGGTGPQNLLIDCTGIKAEGEGEWNARNHGGSKQLIRRKILIGIDEEALEIPPTKPRRNQDALAEPNGPIAHGTGLRQASCGNPNPYRRAQSLYCAWHT